MTDKSDFDSECSFCGKLARDVEVLVAAKNASICEECISHARDAVGFKRLRKIYQIERGLR